jgi:hypothetical protein
MAAKEELDEYEFRFSLIGRGKDHNSALVELMMMMKIDPGMMIENRATDDVLYRKMDETDYEDESLEDQEHEVICAMIDWKPDEPTLA